MPTYSTRLDDNRPQKNWKHPVLSVTLFLSAGRKSGCVGETEIGIGQTSLAAWKINVISPQTVTAVYFEVMISAGQPSQQGSCDPIQFVTHYQHSYRQQQLCITTITHNFAEAPSQAGSPHVVASLDQEAAAAWVLMSHCSLQLTTHLMYCDGSHADSTLPKVRQLYRLALDWQITSAFILNPCSIFVKVSSCRCLITVQMNCFLSVNIFSLSIVESLGWWWFSYALNEQDINNSTDLV